jgi:hypothetical protein
MKYQELLSVLDRDHAALKEIQDPKTNLLAVQKSEKEIAMQLDKEG